MPAIYPEYHEIERQYGAVTERIAGLGARLKAIDAANGGSLDVAAVGRAACEVLAMPRGQRPSRMVIDGQNKGTEEIDAACHRRQGAFLSLMGLEDLMPPSPFGKHLQRE